MGNSKRSQTIIIRLTVEEHQQLKEKSKTFSSISHYIRSAVRSFDDESASARIDRINNLTLYYEKYHNMLFHVSGNLNQTIKRANELAIAGLLDEQYYQQHVLPSVNAVMSLVVDMRTTLTELTRQIAVYK